MKATKTYYLCKQDRVSGPFSSTKIEGMRKSRELFQYAYMMDNETQTWQPTEELPVMNPFLESKLTLKNRDLKAILLFRNQVIQGTVKGMHSRGIEILISTSTKKMKINSTAKVRVGLVDESTKKCINSNLLFEGSEKQPDGTLLRFEWSEGAVTLS